MEGKRHLAVRYEIRCAASPMIRAASEWLWEKALT
jgi:hypothetical protein